MAAAFELRVFDSYNLAESLRNVYTNPVEITSKKQFAYLFGYLTDIGTKTIIIEPDYVSKDYLLDYTNYYAMCFEVYPKTCKRVHFFDSEFNEEEFKKQLSFLPKDEEFWKHYKGFIVVKPIPHKIIGTTVLETYPDKESNGLVRNYFGRRNYNIHLFGTDISVQSLAFQEQDAVLSACATSAIWSMLHKASCNNYAILKTPSEITKEADIIGVQGERMFPNKGLSLLQISKAIYQSGLVSEIRSRRNSFLSNSYLKRMVHAYAPIGIPIIIGLEVFHTGSRTPGLHAVTIAGYRYNRVHPISNPKEEITWRSETIERLFAHDDQFGPFAKITLRDLIDLETDWTKKDQGVFDKSGMKIEPGGRMTKLTDIVVPVYHKIRISLDDVESIVCGIDKILWKIFPGNLPHDISWDVRLDYSDVVKREMKLLLSGQKLIDVLIKPFPKYVWVADSYIGNDISFRIIFDATDLAKSMFGFDAFFFNENIRRDIHDKLSKIPQLSKLITHPFKAQFLDFLKEQTAD